MKTRFFFWLIIVSGGAPEILAQVIYPPPVAWQHAYGGTNDDRLRSLEQTADGGFILGGFSNSRPASGANGDKTSTNFGSYDFWIVRTDANGNKLWDRSFGGTNEEVLFSIQQTRDGGFVLGGYSSSTPGGNKTSPNFGDYDYWVVRIDEAGNKLWDRSFGGTDLDQLRSLRETADGGFILGGQSLSGTGGNKTSGNFGINDCWVVRLDAGGNKLWDHSFGGLDADRLQDVRQTSDGGFILGAVSLSAPSGNKTSASFGLNDMWLVRLDAAGNKVWDRSFGGTDNDEVLSVCETSDGGFVLGGFSWSGSNGNKTGRNYGATDMWLVRTDVNGNKLWDASFGGRNSDSARAIVQTRDGGFVLGGISDSPESGMKASPYFGGIADFWVVRTDPNGNKLWEQSLGGIADDGVWSLRQTADGGFVFGGGSDSPVGGNKTSPPFGNYDFWVVKLAPDSPKLRVPAQSFASLRTNGFRVFLSGVSNNFYRTEFTTNWTDWSPIQTNQVTNAEVEILDRKATNAPRRIYRARLLP